MRLSSLIASFGCVLLFGVGMRLLANRRSAGWLLVAAGVAATAVVGLVGHPGSTLFVLGFTVMLMAIQRPPGARNMLDNAGVALGGAVMLAGAVWVGES